MDLPADFSLVMYRDQRWKWTLRDHDTLHVYQGHEQP